MCVFLVFFIVMSVCVSMCPYVCPPVCLSGCLSVCMSACRSVRLFTHFFWTKLSQRFGFVFHPGCNRCSFFWALLTNSRIWIAPSRNLGFTPWISPLVCPICFNQDLLINSEDLFLDWLFCHNHDGWFSFHKVLLQNICGCNIFGIAWCFVLWLYCGIW